MGTGKLRNSGTRTDRAYKIKMHPKFLTDADVNCQSAKMGTHVHHMCGANFLKAI